MNVMENVLSLQSLEVAVVDYGFAAASCTSCFSGSCNGEVR